MPLQFVHTYATHSSTHYAPLAPAPDCLFVLHLKYMFHNRERWHSSKTSLRWVYCDRDAIQHDSYPLIPTGLSESHTLTVSSFMSKSGVCTCPSLVRLRCVTAICACYGLLSAGVLGTWKTESWSER